MKKTLVLLANFLSAYGAFAFADNSWEVGGYTYHYNVLPGGIDVSPGFNTSSHNGIPAVSPTPTGDFVIPDQLPDCVSVSGVTNFLPVVNIGQLDLYGRSGKAFSSGSMTSVVIPDTVTNIGITAFADSAKLASVTFPKSLKTIRTLAFANCKSLRQVEFPVGFEALGASAFAGCTNLTDVVFHEGLKDIASNAFGGGSFYGWYNFTGNPCGCSNLTSIAIPSSVTNIGARAFMGCTGMQEAFIGGGNIGKSAFLDCIGLKTVTMGDNVTSIGSCAFKGLKSLKEVIIPDSVTNIEAGVFNECTSLQCVVFGRGVKKINSWFRGFTNLEKVVLNDGVEEIDDYAFSGCTNLKEIDIPETVTNIGRYAFNDCRNLGRTTPIVLPSRIMEIKQGTFKDCWSFDVFPSALKRIGGYAFCNVSFRDFKLPESLEEIGVGAFAGASLFGEGVVVIPKSVNYISPGAFFETYIPEGIVIQSGIIGPMAFANSITEKIVLSNWVLSIENDAFHGCTITEIKIPQSVCYIGNRAFSGDDEWLDDYEYEYDGYAWWDDNEYKVDYLDGCPCLTNVVLGGGACAYSLDDDEEETIKIWNLGLDAVIDDIVPYNAIWSEDMGYHMGSLLLGNDVFKNCQNIVSVIVGANVVGIGDNAFKGCSSLRELQIEDHSIDIPVFSQRIECSPDGVYSELWGVSFLSTTLDLSIGSYAFSGCSSLGSVFIPSRVNIIGNSAFANCGSLSCVKIGGEAPSVGSLAFHNVASGCEVKILRGNDTYSVSDGKWQGLKVEYYGPYVGGKGSVAVSGNAYVVKAKEGMVLDVGEFDFTASRSAYTVEIAEDRKSAVVNLNAPIFGSAVGDGDVEHVSDDPSGALVDVAPENISAAPTPQDGETIGALPVKAYQGFYYQASYGSDLGNMSKGAKVKADGEMLYLGVIKQMGNRGFYGVTVSEE